MAGTTSQVRRRVVGVGDALIVWFRARWPAPPEGRVTMHAPCRRYRLDGGRAVALSLDETSRLLAQLDTAAIVQEAELRGLTLSGDDGDDLSESDSAELLEELRRRDDLFGTSLVRDARVAAGGPARVELRGDTVVVDDCPVATLRAGAPASARRRFGALITVLERES